MSEVQNQAFFPPFPILEETLFWEKICKFAYGSKQKVFPSKEQVSFPLGTLVLSEALLLYVQRAKSTLGVPVSECIGDAQDASHWLCELGADVGSMTAPCQQHVLIRTDYSQLVSEEVLFFTVFLLSCFKPFFLRLRVYILKDVPSSSLDVLLFSTSFMFCGFFFKTLSYTWLGIPQIQLFPQ